MTPTVEQDARMDTDPTSTAEKETIASNKRNRYEEHFSFLFVDSKLK